MAMIHSCTREYIYPLARNTVQIKLIVNKNNDCKYSIYYWNNLKREIPGQIKEMTCFARDKDYDHYTVDITVDEAVKYFRYYFICETEDGMKYLSSYGEKTTVPQEIDGFFEYHNTSETDIFSIPKWAKNAVVYQIFPERFFNGDCSNDPDDVKEWGTAPDRENFMGGDIKGVIKKLDYIKDLGVDIIYLTPIFESPSNHKYDTIDYYKIDSHFGTSDDFKELVQKVHDMGLKIILDGVFNHCGYYLKQFQDVVEKGEKSKYADWFYIESFPVSTELVNYECVGYYKWMPRLRFKTREVRDFVLDIGKYWIEEFGIDGWRLDVADEVDFTFWQEFRRAIKSINPDALLIGETWKDGRDMLRGDQMDSVMNYLFYDPVVSYIAKGEIDSNDFDKKIGKMLSLYHSEVYDGLYNLLGSHDTDRFLTLAGKNTDKLILAFVYQMSMNGMSAIYYGDEIAMSGENDPDCRRCMIWEGQNENVRSIVKTLIKIRKENSCLRHGIYMPLLCDGMIYGFAKKYDDEVIYIVLNNENKVCHIQLPVLEENAQYIDLMTGEKYASINQCFEHRYNSDIYDYKGYVDLRLECFGFKIIKIILA